MQHLRSVLSLYRRTCERFGMRPMTHRGNQCLLRFVRFARLLRRGGGGYPAVQLAMQFAR